jgi:hypothetical protein
MDTMAKELTYNVNMVKHLNQLLSSKDEEIEELTQKVEERENAQHTATERADGLANLQDGTQQQLKSTSDERNRLKELTDMQQQQLMQTNRMLHVQESRLGSIKGLVSSLSYNIEAWAVDDEDWDQKTFCTKSSTVLEGLDFVKVKDSTNGRTNAAFATISPEKDCDKSAGTTNVTAAIDDEDISTLDISTLASPSPSPARERIEEADNRLS